MKPSVFIALLFVGIRFVPINTCRWPIEDKQEVWRPTNYLAKSLTAHISRCDNDTLKHTQVILDMHCALGNTQHIRDKLRASHAENKFN